jgi:hypothetical protein
VLPDRRRILTQTLAPGMKRDAVYHPSPKTLRRTSVPVFTGTDVPIQTFLDSLEGGDTLDKFLSDFPSVSRMQAEAFLEMTKADNSKAWALVFHEDTLFHNRIEIFLTAHTLLLTAVGLVLSKDNPPQQFLIGVSIFGIWLGAFWIFIQRRSKIIVKRVEELLEPDPSYARVSSIKWLIPYSQTSILATILPGSITAGWVLLLLAFYFEWIHLTPA